MKLTARLVGGWGKETHWRQDECVCQVIAANFLHTLNVLIESGNKVGGVTGLSRSTGLQSATRLVWPRAYVPVLALNFIPR